MKFHLWINLLLLISLRIIHSKVSPEDRKFYCVNCGRFRETALQGLRLPLTLRDYSCQVHAVAFGAVAEDLLGVSATTLARMAREKTPEELQSFLNRLLFRDFTFRFRTRGLSDVVVLFVSRTDYRNLMAAVFKDLVELGSNC